MFKPWMIVRIVVVIVALSGIGAIAAHYFRDLHTAKERLASLDSQVLETECGSIEYVRVGDGYPVLVLHGTMGGFDAGLQLAEPLIDAGYQVISVSRFSYLRSPIPSNADVNMQADLYACLLDAMGIREVAVLTTSGGAVSTIRFATRYPERISALIMVSPSAPGTIKVSPPPKAVFSTVMRSDFIWWALCTYFQRVALTVIGVPSNFDLTPEQEAYMREVLATTLPISQRIDGFIFDNYNVDTEFYAEIDETSPYSVYKINVPVLVINALDDPYAKAENVRGVAEKFPNAQLFIVPEGGHQLIGHEVEVNTQITQFLFNHLPMLESSQ